MADLHYTAWLPDPAADGRETLTTVCLDAVNLKARGTIVSNTRFKIARINCQAELTA